MAKTAIPQNNANPKETKGMSASNPIITKMISAKFPDIFMSFSNLCTFPTGSALIDTITQNT